MKKIRWGILSTAKIGREKVIPAMQAGHYCSVDAIASRSTELAVTTAESLGIKKVYSSYDALLADPDIDAVYIPLPNQLHVPWAIKAMQANKHVLCEKPIGLTSAEGKQLLMAAQQHPHLKVMEAFMYRFHPQWQHAKKLVNEGAIGKMQTIQSFFSYYNVDAADIRNQKEAGGGGLMDIGCYCISLSRFLFDAEPKTVFASADFDPVFKTDRLASGILNFEKGRATFTCSTQLTPYQRVNIVGTQGRIKMDIPFSPPALTDAHIWLHRADDVEKIIFDAVDQYTIQGDLFSKAILDGTPVPTGLQDSINNMLVIEATFKSIAQGRLIEL